MKSIKIFQDKNGRLPFQEWRLSQSLDTRAVIDVYIDRVAQGGSIKNIKSLGDGVYEIKITIGPAYRIYFAYENNAIILLLVGGTKKSQDKDIKLAKKYWSSYE